MQYLYLALAFLGIILPYSQYIPFHLENGFNIPLMFEQLFVNNITMFFAFDLFVAAAVVIVFIIHEGRKKEIKYYWIPLLSIFMIGLAFAFPLFLYLRERQLKK